MAGGLAELDAGFPQNTGTVERRVQAVYDYLVLLLENLRYILRNLGPENMNESELLPWLDEVLRVKTLVADTVVTDQLCADYGAIADLVVDELRTDYRKAWNYLHGVTDSVDYLHIYDENIDLLTDTVRTSDGVPAGLGGEPLTEQLTRVFRDPRDPEQLKTRRFWWTDETKTQMTSLEETAWPVVVYRYDTLVKGSLRFRDFTQDGVTTKIPTLLLGAGVGDPDDPAMGRGFLRKGTDSLDLWLHTTYGADNGIFIGNRYTDLRGLRKTTELDFRAWDSGSFSEAVDGGVRTVFTLAADELGRPVRITDGEGHETAVRW